MNEIVNKQALIKCMYVCVYAEMKMSTYNEKLVV